MVKTLGLEELEQWLESLGLLQGGGTLETEAAVPLQERLKDGVAFCQLVNVIRPGSVEEVSLKSSLSLFSS